jgi:raffinose/stachyose/melibiose transport system permease protein
MKTVALTRHRPDHSARTQHEARDAVTSSASHGPRRNNLTGYLYVAPAVLLVVGIVYFAVGYTLRMSVLDWDGLSPDPVGVGLGNYARLLEDPVFWRSLGHMAMFALAVLVQMALGLGFAILLHSGVRAKTLYKVLLFLPVVLAPAVMAPVFRQIFDADGQLNTVLRAVGLDALAHPWLADPSTALYALIAVNIWQWTGFSFVLYYAGLTQVDASLIEAARIDGAGNWRVIYSLLIPLTRGTTVTLAILGVIGTIKTFDIPYLVTGGGPARSTEVLATYLYQQGITDFHVGYGAALTVVLMVMSLILTVSQVRRFQLGSEA